LSQVTLHTMPVMEQEPAAPSSR